MNIIKISIALLFFATIMSCSGEAEQSDTKAEVIEETNENSASGDIAVCEILTKEEIKKALGIDNIGDPVSEEVMKRDDWEQHSCRYSLDDIESNLTIYVTYGDALNSTEEAIKKYQIGIDYLTKGVKQEGEHKGTKATFSYKGEFHTIDDLGAAAAWQPAKSKYISGYVTFVTGNYIFQVHPGIYGEGKDEENYKAAIALANTIIDKLN